MKDTSLVSVIIPTKNSGDTLEKCLKSIRGQTYSSIEIIVVDCFSGDKTRKIAEDYGATICESTAKRSQARNIGAQKAMGDLFFFVDSDMELLPSVVAECIKKIRERYDGVIVPEVSVGEGFWAECKALEKACYVGDDTIEAARLFTKNVFESICGYDSELEAGEDWDLSQRTTKAGYQIGRIGAFIMHNEGRLSLRETMLSKHYYGHAFEHYRVKHPQEAKYQLKLIRPAFIKNWKKLAKDPVHASGMLFMKACESAAVWFGMLTQETRI